MEKVCCDCFEILLEVCVSRGSSVQLGCISKAAFAAPSSSLLARANLGCSQGSVFPADEMCETVKDKPLLWCSFLKVHHGDAVGSGGGV